MHDANGHLFGSIIYSIVRHQNDPFKCFWTSAKVDRHLHVYTLSVQLYFILDTYFQVGLWSYYTIYKKKISLDVCNWVTWKLKYNYIHVCMGHYLHLYLVTCCVFVLQMIHLGLTSHLQPGSVSNFSSFNGRGRPQEDVL